MKPGILPPSTNVQDYRMGPQAPGPSTNPFSYAQDRDTVNIQRGYQGPSPQPNVPNNPFQSAIDSIQKAADASHEQLKSTIADTIGQLNRTDPYGYNVRSRVRTGALRPETRGTPNGTSSGT